MWLKRSLQHKQLAPLSINREPVPGALVYAEALMRISFLPRVNTRDSVHGVGQYIERAVAVVNAKFPNTRYYMLVTSPEKWRGFPHLSHQSGLDVDII